MTLYLSVIFACMLVIATLSKTVFWNALGITALCTVCVVVIDGLTATLARLLPASFAEHTKRMFQVSAKEKAFYEHIRIRRWKERIPELGHCTGFRKNKIAKPKDEAYLNRFLMEICYGEIGHFFSCITGFCTLFLCLYEKSWLEMALWVSIVNAVLNVLPLFVLRYNSYKLRILLKQVQKQRDMREKTFINA